MATAAAQPSPCPPVATGLPGRRFDHFFFSGMALLMLVTVFVGFAPSYYLAGLFRAPLPSPIIHLHGALFSCWICCWSRKLRWSRRDEWTCIGDSALQGSY